MSKSSGTIRSLELSNQRWNTLNIQVDADIEVEDSDGNKIEDSIELHEDLVSYSTKDKWHVEQKQIDKYHDILFELTQFNRISDEDACYNIIQRQLGSAGIEELLEKLIKQNYSFDDRIYFITFILNIFKEMK